MRLNLPLELPTQQFLSRGAGRVLDGGAGSGRASLMVLLERPQAEVLAVDLYQGYFGIGR
jgi:methylase of polypeptide subunit release factors